MRQRILYHSYDNEACHSTICYRGSHEAENPCTHYASIEDLSKTLNLVDSRLTEDIEFAEKAWKRAHTEMRAATAKEVMNLKFQWSAMLKLNTSGSQSSGVKRRDGEVGVAS